MSKEITLKISNEEYELIAKIFSGESQKELTNKKFMQFAFNNALNWITGKKRYRTMTEQYIDWVENLYINVISGKEKPSYDRLYNSFNMTPGQAAYIARVLKEKKLSDWRKLAQEELLKELKNHQGEAEEYKNQGDQDVNITITIDELASLELKRITEQIWQDDRSFNPPRRKDSFANIIHYEVPFESLLELIKYLNKS